MRTTFALVAALLLPVLVPPAAAQSYPSKPASFIIPFSPGGCPGSRRWGIFWGGDGARPPGLWQVVRRLVIAIMLPVIAFATASVAAQTYPSKPVRFIIPFAPGGGNDIIGRAIAARLSETWKQQMVVDNRPGAGGNIAGEITAHAAPDGYTVFQFNVANVIAASLYPKLAYDPVRDFAPVTQIGASPFLLVIHPGVRATNVRELIALAKAQPKLLNYASSGNGGSSHLVTELFKALAAYQ